MKVTLKNFMKHENLSLEFGEGITLISGGNNTGKSTIIRALSVIMDGRITEKHIRHGASECEIVLEGDGFTAKVKRDTSGVAYAFNDSEYIGKVGAKRFWEVFPDFPLKPFELAGGETLLPFVVPQKQVPVFGQVKLFEFFSSLFSLTNAVQNSVNDSKETLNEAKSGSKLLSSLYAEKQKQVYALEKEFNAEELVALEGLEASAVEASVKSKELSDKNAERESLISEIGGMIDLQKGEALLSEVYRVQKALLDYAEWKRLSRLRDKIIPLCKSVKEFDVGYAEAKTMADRHTKLVMEKATAEFVLGTERKIRDKMMEGGVCPSCGQKIKLEGGSIHMAELEEKIKALEEKILKLTAELEEISSRAGFKTEEELVKEQENLVAEINKILESREGF